MAKTAQPKTDRRKSTPRTRKAAPDAIADIASVSDEAIAARAFEYFTSRGGAHGHDVEDWLAAEQELRAGA